MQRRKTDTHARTTDRDADAERNAKIDRDAFAY